GAAAGRASAVRAARRAHRAAACARPGVGRVQVPTAYVFPGRAGEPYPVEGRTGPASVYGASKLAGERAVLDSPVEAWVVRTAWVYGAAGGNFVKTIARLERSRPTLDVVDDQRGSPTWSRDLARGLLALAGGDAPPGVYHCTNDGDTTWYGLARAVFEELGADPDRIPPTSTAAFPRAAPPARCMRSGPAGWGRGRRSPPRAWGGAGGAPRPPPPRRRPRSAPPPRGPPPAPPRRGARPRRSQESARWARIPAAVMSSA